jgi:hypothetical protein
LRRLILIVALLFALPPASAEAVLRLQTIERFEQPISIAANPGDPDRLLVAERPGRVKEVSPAGTTLLLDLASLVSCCVSERGLLSIAPAPDYSSSGRIYVAYTGTAAAGGAEGDIHVDAFRPGQPREPILSIAHATRPNHNGGQLQFGPDGYLYIATGDGGGVGDPDDNAQNLESSLGKLLRIDPRPGQPPPYAVPAGNPLTGSAGLDEIWAYGLRNPWRFSFDRLSGDLIVADVGQEEREEVNVTKSPGPGVVGGSGANYGWDCREGLIAYSSPSPACALAGAFAEPVFDYPHDDPGGGAAYGCSIIGGYVARDPSLGDIYGRYLYIDYCTREIRSLRIPAGPEPVSDDRSEGVFIPDPTSFGEDSCGRVYLASANGTVYRLQGDAPAVCPRAQPAGPGPASTLARRRGRLLLSAKRLRSGSARFKVRTRLEPCADGAGSLVRLKRQGRSFASKHLRSDCVAVFRLRVGRPTGLRAVSPEHEGGPLRSNRLLLVPPSRR